MAYRGEIDPAKYSEPEDDGSVPASTEFDPAADQQDAELPDVDRDYDPDPQAVSDGTDQVS